MNNNVIDINLILNALTVIFSCCSMIIAICALKTWERELLAKKKYDLNSKAYDFLFELKNILKDINIKYCSYEEISNDTNIKLCSILDEFVKSKNDVLTHLYNDLRRLKLLHSSITYLFQEFQKYLAAMNDETCYMTQIINADGNKEYYIRGNLYYKYFIDENSEDYANNMDCLIDKGLHEFDNRVIDFYLGHK